MKNAISYYILSKYLIKCGRYIKDENPHSFHFIFFSVNHLSNISM